MSVYVEVFSWTIEIVYVVMSYLFIVKNINVYFRRAIIDHLFKVICAHLSKTTPAKHQTNLQSILRSQLFIKYKRYIEQRKRHRKQG